MTARRESACDVTAVFLEEVWRGMAAPEPEPEPVPEPVAETESLVPTREPQTAGGPRREPETGVGEGDKEIVAQTTGKEAADVKAWLRSLDLESYSSAFLRAGYTSLRFIKAVDPEDVIAEVNMKRPHARVFAQACANLAETKGDGSSRARPAAPAAGLQTSPTDGADPAAASPATMAQTPRANPFPRPTRTSEPAESPNAQTHPVWDGLAERSRPNRKEMQRVVGFPAFESEDARSGYAASQETVPISSAFESEGVQRERAKLQQIAPSKLMQIAADEGLDSALIGAAVDSDSPEEALVNLILNHRASGGERGRLLQLPPSELHRRAWATGASKEEVAAAWDSADRKTSLVELILTHGGSRDAIASMSAAASGSHSSLSALAGLSGWSAGQQGSPLERGSDRSSQVSVLDPLIATEDSSSDCEEFEDDDSERGLIQDEIFNIETCTLLVRGIPAEASCDQEWLREVFGEHGEFVQGTIRLHVEAGTTNYAIISFRNPNDVRALLSKAVYPGIRSARNLRKRTTTLFGVITAKRLAKAKKAALTKSSDSSMADALPSPDLLNPPSDWVVRMQSFEAADEAAANAWHREGTETGEVRLCLYKFDISREADRSGLPDAFDEARAKARAVVQDLHLFFTIERGHDLPAMDADGGVDPYCEVSHVEKPQVRAHKTGRRNLSDIARGSKKSRCTRLLEVLNPLHHQPKMPVHTSKITLGRTPIGKDHYPSWLWTIPKPHPVSGMGKRGWIVIGLNDADVLEDDHIGEIQINLDEVPRDKLIECWYAVAPGHVVDGICTDEDGSLGCIKVRMLLSSYPDLADASNSWLLNDYSIQNIFQTARDVKDKIKTDQHNRSCNPTTTRAHQADHARLMWHLNSLVDEAFQHIDRNGDGWLRPLDVSWMMASLGEPVDQNELASMITESKVWCLPTVKELKNAESEAREAVVGTEEELQLEMERILLKQWNSAENAQVQTLPVDPDNPEEIVAINLASPQCKISWNEFKIMLTEYWTTRKKHSVGGGNQLTATDSKRSLSATSTANASHSNNIAICVVGGLPGDPHSASAAMTTDNAHTTGSSLSTILCGKRSIPDAESGEAVPSWLGEIARSYEPIAREQRTPVAFWHRLTSQMQQVVMRAQARGIRPGGGRDSFAADRLATEAALAMKKWSIRSIATADGMSAGSKFSISWDLMQVILLAWVLISVPFSIAFDIDAGQFTLLWWWELWVDIYFVLDIILNFRTPYYTRYELHFSGAEMAKNYLKGWFLPDVLSCASMIQYLTFLDDAEVGQAGSSSHGLQGDIEGAGDANASRLAKLVRLTKLAKLLRLARLKRVIERGVEKNLSQTIASRMVTLGAMGSLAKLVLSFTLAMHLVTCVYFVIGDACGTCSECGKCEDDGWVYFAFPRQNETTIQKYFSSMAQVALGNFVGSQSQAGEEAFAVFSALFNSFVFGAVAATFSSIMVHVNEPYVAYNSKMDELKTWMRNVGLKVFDVDTQKQIQDFYGAKLAGGKAGENKLVDEANIINEFQPAPIVDEIVTVLYTGLIRKVPIFTPLADEVVSLLCRNLRPLPALKGSPVCIQGRIADCMYIVRNGRLQNWENSTTVPMMARCTLKESLDGIPENATQFWATVYDELESDHVAISHMKADLEKLTLHELMQQCEHAGISNPQSLMNKKGDERDVLIRECLDRACGGTIDMGGQQHQKLLRHRTLDRKATMITGRARHASHPASPGVLRRMPRYWKDFVSGTSCAVLAALCILTNWICFPTAYVYA